MEHDYPELSGYLDGELSASEREAVDARLAADPDYAHELARLRKAKEMLTMYMEGTAFQSSVLTRVKEEKRAMRRRDARRKMLTVLLTSAAAVAVIVAAVFFASNTGNQPEPQLPEMPAVAMPAPSDNDQDTPTEAVSPPQIERFEVAQASGPSFQLLGSITGENAVATIKTVQDGAETTKSYSVGDSVADGVKLVEVQKSAVVLDDHGQQVTLAMGAVPSVSPMDKLAGLWNFAQLEGTTERPLGVITVTVNGTRMRIQSGDSGFNDEGEVRISDDTWAFFSERPNGTFELDGTFETPDRVIVTPVAGPNGPFPAEERETFVMTRLPKDAAESEMARTQTQARMKDDLTAMYAVLDKYAADNDGKFPAALDALVPNYAPDLNLFADTDDREVQYFPGKKPPKFEIPSIPPIEPAETLAERLVEHEQQLRDMGMMELLLRKKLVRVAYKKPEVAGTVDTMGTVSEEPNQTELGVSKMRADCQNNLKQFGLIIKMFMVEHVEITPPGWCTVYPEYMTDPSILTCPKEPVGSDSYIYLLPAVDTKALVEETMEKMGVTRETDPEAPARIEAQIPVMMNAKEWTVPTPGRNVLFLDGHVSYVRDLQKMWDEVPPEVDRGIFAAMPK